MRPQMGTPETSVGEFPGGDGSGRLEMEAFETDIQLRRRPDPGLPEAFAALKVVETIYARSGYALAEPDPSLC